MEKAPIKKFAVEARRKLIADVTFQLERYGITEKGIVEPQTSTDKELVFDLGSGNIQTIRGERAVNQYKNLVAHVRGFYTADEPKKELEQFIEEVAYTWFNRLIAIRFMEVNRYLPVRVLSSEITGQKLPDLVKAPFSGDLEFTEDEKQRIFDLQDANKEDDLFRFLFFKQCNDLSRILPRLFEDLDGSNSFSELLITLSFNDPNGVVYRLVNEVDERWFDIHATDEDGKPLGQVQIMGWMYQYYNTEPKDKVFADLKKNIKISKQNIPAATQLFTPDWIVRYMVENSLGRLWAEGHPDFDKSDWKYYLDEAPQEPQVEQQLKDIRAQYAKMEPEQLKVIDPCMGSGHILCYLFDVLMQIYLDNGYSKREAVRSILENNLFGLDIDKRAAQFAYFSVMMKAREYDSGFFGRKNIPQPRVYDIQESNWMGGAYKHEMGNFLNSQAHRDTLNYLLDAFIDAKEYGSILQIRPLDYEGLKEAWQTSAAATASNVNMAMWYDAVKDSVEQLIEQAILLSQKYDAVVTNPPYMGSGNMGGLLSEYTKKVYPDTKYDLFACCIKNGFNMLKPTGFNAMVTMHAWMFLSSYETLRDEIIQTKTIRALLQMDNMVMGIAFGTAATIIENSLIKNYTAAFTKIKMSDMANSLPENFPAESFGIHYRKPTRFLDIPGHTIAYWISDAAERAFREKTLGLYATTRLGMSTANNDRFMRNWFEVSSVKAEMNVRTPSEALASGKKWFPYNKGGSFRKWYGNNDYVVNWENDGAEIKNFKDEKTGRIRSHNYNADFGFRESLTWSDISSAHNFGIRYSNQGKLFDGRGSSLFTGHENIFQILAFLCSTVAGYFLSIINQTMVFNVGDVAQLPIADEIVKNKHIGDVSTENIQLSKKDWDAFETSWDFKRHPLV